MSFKNKTTTHFWDDTESEHYAQFAVTIPSDIPAYQMMYEAVSPLNKIVLDYGCFRGNSSIRILQQGAQEVIGIDAVEVNVKEAVKNFSTVDNLKFLHVPADEFIPSMQVDITYMSFVHPTISTMDMLAFTFKKIFASLKSGGQLIILGLDPASLNQEYSFLFYKHHLIEGTLYKDGVAFQNKLLLSDKNHVEFMDYCWTSNTLYKLLKDIGFKSIDEIYLKDSNSTLMNLANEVAKKYKLEWLDEWVAPLYQLFVIQK